MDTKKMLQDGFVKKQVAILIHKDINSRAHTVVIDTPEHAKQYKAGEDMRLATMYALMPPTSSTEYSEELKIELGNAIAAYGKVLHSALLGTAVPSDFEKLKQCSEEELKHKMQILKDFYSQL